MRTIRSLAFAGLSVIALASAAAAAPIGAVPPIRFGSRMPAQPDGPLWAFRFDRPPQLRCQPDASGRPW